MVVGPFPQHSLGVFLSALSSTKPGGWGEVAPMPMASRAAGDGRVAALAARGGSRLKYLILPCPRLTFLDIEGASQ